MNRISIVLSLVFGLLLCAVPASAQFKAKAVSNPPGLFNRTVSKAKGNGAAAASVGGFRGAAAASAGGFGGFNVAASAGRFNAAASVGGFNNFAVRNVHGFNHGFNNVAFAGVPANVAFSGQQVLFVNQNKVRFNAFGVSTVQDAFGNVFEVDAFGNARFVGNRLGSSAVVTGFVPTASSFGGFSNVRAVGGSICGF